jgi:hypothetical protein
MVNNAAKLTALHYGNIQETLKKHQEIGAESIEFKLL